MDKDIYSWFYDSTSDFSTILNLPPGTHRIKFIVDDEWKCSTELSAATDVDGNLVNFLEVADEDQQDELEGGQGKDIVTNQDISRPAALCLTPLIFIDCTNIQLLLF